MHSFKYAKFAVYRVCTITSKSNGTYKGVYLSISKVQSILAVANLLSIITCGYILLWTSKFTTAKIECSSEMCKLTPLGGTIYFAGDGTL